MPKKRGYLEAFSEYPKIFDPLTPSTTSANFHTVHNTSEFLALLDANSSSSSNEVEEDKLTVLIGTSKDVQVSQQIIPIINQFAKQCPKITFIQADLEENEEIRTSQKIETIPTFIFYKKDNAVKRIEGAFPEEVKEHLKKLGGNLAFETGSGGDSDLSAEAAPQGTVDLIHYVNLKECEALNCSDETPFTEFIERKSRILSDCDEQLILAYSFNQLVKLHSIRIQGPLDKGPTSLKIFINQLASMDFEDVQSRTCTQLISLSKEDLKGESLLTLNQVKFQKVKNVYIFISGNQSGEEITEIDALTLYGQPLNKEKGISGHTSSFITIS